MQNFNERVVDFKKEFEELVKKYDVDIVATVKWLEFGAVPQINIVDANTLQKVGHNFQEVIQDDEQKQGEIIKVNKAQSLLNENKHGEMSIGEIIEDN